MIPNAALAMVPWVGAIVTAAFISLSFLYDIPRNDTRNARSRV